MPNHAGAWILISLAALGIVSMSSVCQQALPDLAISKVWIGDKNNTPIVPKAGEPFYVCATVKNVGGALAEGYYVQPYFGGGPLAMGGPGRLEPAGAQDWSSGPVTVGAGIYEVRWVINPDRRIPEGNYGNNEISIIVVVEAGSALDTLLAPVGGPVGLAVIVLGILAVGMVLRKYVERRRRTQAVPVKEPRKNKKSS